MAQHTPGPWEVSSMKKTRTVANERLNEYVCTLLFAHEPSTIANARLISAAPDMLEALKALIANLDEGEFISETRIDAARAAIAKAEGRT